MNSYKNLVLHLIKVKTRFKIKERGVIMAKVGDKYIIEIGGASMEHVTLRELYRIKGFNSLVFDENGLNKLKPYEDIGKARDAAYGRGFKDGLKDAWEAAKKICCNAEVGKFPDAEIGKIFGEDWNIDTIMGTHSAEQAIEKIKTYEEQKKAEEEIKVGDEIYSELTNKKAVFIGLDAWGNWQYMTNCGNFKLDNNAKKYWVKTGRHFPQIEEMLEEMEKTE